MTEVSSGTTTTVRERAAIKLDSQAQTVEHLTCPHVSSEQLANESGQPSIWVIFPMQRTDNEYVYSEPVVQVPDLDPELEREFQAWDQLSDESFIDFEQSLD